ncbi:MAG: hypothetical protein DMD78_18050 [Candidatus Rokuibacteriota bacterium]|nr:MAG: hypothetical protein DMD78_18050 [Candidatus Rokubacteria bacterium]
MTRAAWLGLLVVASTVACTPPPRAVAMAPRLALSPCEIPKSSVEARCGALEVFEDRAARSGRVIPIKVLVLPALGEERARDPIFVLAGGPGLGAASAMRDADAGFFEGMRARRDVVFIDQRGTGGSHRLSCRLTTGSGAQATFGDLLPPDRIRACRETLEKIADLRLYTTPIAMDDVDDVRAALGYATINLYGVSYASLAAARRSSRTSPGLALGNPGGQRLW